MYDKIVGEFDPPKAIQDKENRESHHNLANENI